MINPDELNDNSVEPTEDNSGVEQEETVGEDAILAPFDPTQIRVETRPLTIDLIIARMENKEINLAPDFQRKAGIWDNVAQSRLIESILIRIPLPAFYFDATDDDDWVVIDGLQRLTTLNHFVLEKKLRLTGLEFLTQLNNKNYAEMPRNFQRRIREAQVTGFMITRGTPDEVKFTIFRRINTGGKPLSSQAIRHALNQGNITRLLAKLAGSEDFRRAIDNGVSDNRMDDRELVLRFLTFNLIPYQSYTRQDFDSFLNGAMRQMNRLPEAELQRLEANFKRAMQWAYTLFGKDAFRKRLDRKATRKPINKSLFEAWSVNVQQLSDQQLERLHSRKAVLIEKFIELMNTDRLFETAISEGTGDVKKVHYRFARIGQLIEEVLA